MAFHVNFDVAQTAQDRVYSLAPTLQINATFPQGFFPALGDTMSVEGVFLRANDQPAVLVVKHRHMQISGEDTFLKVTLDLMA